MIEKLKDEGALNTASFRKTLTALQVELSQEAAGKITGEFEGFMNERIKFENEAKSFFTDIFSKLEDVNQMLSQACLSGSIQLEPVKERSQFVESISKERERLENLVGQKIEQIFTSRLRDISQNSQSVNKALPLTSPIVRSMKLLNEDLIYILFST